MSRRLFRPVTFAGLAVALTLVAGYAWFAGNIGPAILFTGAAIGCWSVVLSRETR